MTTIRLKFRSSSVEGRPGTLYYQICRRQSYKRINTRMHIYPFQWDPASCTLRHDKDRLGILSEYQKNIDRDLLLLRDIVDKMNSTGKDYTPGDVISRFMSKGHELSAVMFMKHEIQALTCAMKLGSARNHRKTLNSFSAFLHNHDILLSDLDWKLISEYEYWLYRRNVARNTVSFYMRILRSVYNKAVKGGLIVQKNPFKDAYTGIEHTRKRAVDEDVMLRLISMDLSCSEALTLARDLFIFSYCARGMAFVDIVFLHKSDITGNILRYVRKKTGQQMCIRIEPCLRCIIDRYSAITADSPYVFPVIKSTDTTEAYRQYQTALGYHNRKLKRISRMLGLDTPLSSYVSRHTWATTARNRNTPIAVISSGMGHTSEHTTQIYLAAISDSVIDQFNHHILDPLNKAVESM